MPATINCTKHLLLIDALLAHDSAPNVTTLPEGSVGTPNTWKNL